MKCYSLPNRICFEPHPKFEDIHAGRRVKRVEPIEDFGSLFVLQRVIDITVGQDIVYAKSQVIGQTLLENDIGRLAIVEHKN